MKRIQWNVKFEPVSPAQAPHHNLFVTQATNKAAALRSQFQHKHYQLGTLNWKSKYELGKTH